MPDLHQQRISLRPIVIHTPLLNDVDHDECPQRRRHVRRCDLGLWRQLHPQVIRRFSDRFHRRLEKVHLDIHRHGHLHLPHLILDHVGKVGHGLALRALHERGEPATPGRRTGGCGPARTSRRYWGRFSGCCHRSRAPCLPARSSRKSVSWGQPPAITKQRRRASRVSRLPSFAALYIRCRIREIPLQTCFACRFRYAGTT
mmetsp:Transcript_13936/g.40003  ORF Transcript_13936/g.40003 Transcript_13936/m.40003 type:complete len:201 (-) Transcript_13936:16-618(-)